MAAFRKYLGSLWSFSALAPITHSPIKGGGVVPVDPTPPVSGFVYSDGDDFTGPMSIVGPSNLRGDYFPTRGGYLIAGSPQRPRGSNGLLGTDIDPLFTGYMDSNRGQPIAAFADLMKQEGGILTLKQRWADPTTERIHFPDKSKTLASSMIHTAGRLLLRQPFYVEARVRYPNSVGGFAGGWWPSVWMMQAANMRSYEDLEVDFEGPNAEMRYYNWIAGSSASNGTGGIPGPIRDNNFHKLGFKVSEGVNPNTGNPALRMDYYFDDVLKFSLYSENGYLNKDKPHYLLITNHTTTFDNNFTEAAWQARGSEGHLMEVDYYRGYRAVGSLHYAPLVAQSDINADFNAAFSTVLPNAATVWGDATVTDTVEPLIMDENEPGQNMGAGGYGTTENPWLTGVSYDIASRTLSGQVASRPGRVNIVRHASKPGATCKPQRFAINIGPTFTQTVALPNAEIGVPYSTTIPYTAVDCGQLLPSSWQVTGLPAGLVSARQSNGDLVISGTPSGSPATASVTVRGVNSLGQAAQVVTSLVVSDPAILVPPVLSGLILDINPQNAARLTTSVSGSDTLLDQASGDNGTAYRIVPASGSGKVKVVDRVSPVGSAVSRKALLSSGAEIYDIVDGSGNSFGAAFPDGYTIVDVYESQEGATTTNLFDVSIPGSTSTRDRVTIFSQATGGIQHRRANAAANSDIGQSASTTQGVDNQGVRHLNIMYAAAGSAQGKINTDHGAVRTGTNLTLARGFTSATFFNRKSSSGGAGAIGYLHRRLIFNRVLTTAEITQMADWATSKYGTA